MSTYNWGELTHLRFVGWTTKYYFCSLISHIVSVLKSWCFPFAHTKSIHLSKVNGICVKHVAIVSDFWSLPLRLHSVFLRVGEKIAVQMSKIGPWHWLSYVGLQRTFIIFIGKLSSLPIQFCFPLSKPTSKNLPKLSPHPPQAKCSTPIVPSDPRS